MILAAEHPTVWSWFAVAGVGLLLCVGGRALIRANEQDRARVLFRRNRVLALPADLRLQSSPLWQRLAMIVVAIGAAIAVGRALGLVAAVAAVAIVLTPFYSRTLRQRAEHQRNVIATVRERAA